MAERILEGLKSYIYIPDKGDKMLLTILFNHKLNQIMTDFMILSSSVSFPTKAGGISICFHCGDLSCKSLVNYRCNVLTGCTHLWTCVVSNVSVPSQTALLLVILVVPTLHIVRAGIDENIAFLLMGFGIVLSEDRMEVVDILTFYTWLLEGKWGQFFEWSQSLC